MIYELLLDRRLGGWHMPDNVSVIAAGNRLSDGAGGFEMDTALADRVSHYYVKANAEDWLKWGVKNNIHPAVLTFIKNRPDMLDQNDDFENLLRTSCRSWEKVSNVIWLNDNPATVKIHIEGRIGIQNTATFLYTLEEIKSLPDLSLLWKATDAELERYGKEMFDTNSKVYGLAYALNSASNKVARLARATKIFIKIVNAIPFKGKEELRSMGLSLMLETAASKDGWLLKLLEEPDYLEEAYQFSLQHPDLATLIKHLPTM